MVLVGTVTPLSIIVHLEHNSGDMLDLGSTDETEDTVGDRLCSGVPCLGTHVDIAGEGRARLYCVLLHVLPHCNVHAELPDYLCGAGGSVSHRRSFSTVVGMHSILTVSDILLLDQHHTPGF